VSWATTVPPDYDGHVAAPEKPNKRRGTSSKDAKGSRVTRKEDASDDIGGVQLKGAASRKSSLASRASTAPVAETSSDLNHRRLSSRTPQKIEDRPTPKWAIIFFFGFLALGALALIINYIPMGFPGTPSNYYLVGGLGCMTVGFMFGTKIR
jgi:hypothetical protein